MGTLKKILGRFTSRVIYLEQLKDEVLRYTQANLSLSTQKLYVSAFRNLLNYVGNKPIKLITTRELDNYKIKRTEKIEKSTVNIELTCLKAVFNLALKWNLINNNPAKDVKKFSIEQKERLSFNDTETKLLLATIPEGSLKNVVLLGLYTGCRLNEILNIQIKDIDLNERIITIRNKPDFKTKTGKIRQIPISDSLRGLLESLLGQVNNVYELNNPETYLFRNGKGLRFDKNFISKKFKFYLRRAGFPEKFHFHCLRHTFITTLIKKGVNINFVKELVGHSQLSTTMNYIHIVTDDLREAVNKINMM